MYLMIDHYDSFVYNLVHYFRELDQEIVVYRNDEITIEEIERLRKKQPLKGIILSPGPKNPEHVGITLDIIHAYKDVLPILGICLGHQTIAYAFGAQIVEGVMPMHGKVTMIEHDQSGLFKNLPKTYKVTRYHSLVVEAATLPKGFMITCSSIEGAIMGIRHQQHLLEGVQFHPEAVLTEYGHELLQNYIDWCEQVWLR